MIPTERDLPPAARDAARARVVALADGSARPPRRWVPVVAALAVVAAVAVPVATLGRDARAPSHTLPAETVIADHCLDGLSARFAAGMSMRALFTDERGYVVYVAARNKLIYCAFAWDGSLDHRSASTEGPILPDGYAPARSPAGLGGLNNMVDGSTDRLPGPDETLYSTIYYGSVTKNVRSLTLTVQGVGPVQADLRGPAWIARVVFHGPADRKQLLRTVITTYDANGRTIGAFRIFG